MRAPFLIPYTILCGYCGYSTMQSERINIHDPEMPYVTVSCLNTHCKQKDVPFKVQIVKATLIPSGEQTLEKEEQS